MGWSYDGVRRVGVDWVGVIWGGEGWGCASWVVCWWCELGGMVHDGVGWEVWI